MDCEHTNTMTLFSIENGAIQVLKCEDCGEYVIALEGLGVTRFVTHDELLVAAGFIQN